MLHDRTWTQIELTPANTPAGLREFTHRRRRNHIRHGIICAVVVGLAPQTLLAKTFIIIIIIIKGLILQKWHCFSGNTAAQTLLSMHLMLFCVSLKHSFCLIQISLISTFQKMKRMYNHHIIIIKVQTPNWHKLLL